MLDREIIGAGVLYILCFLQPIIMAKALTGITNSRRILWNDSSAKGKRETAGIKRSESGNIKH